MVSLCKALTLLSTISSVIAVAKIDTHIHALPPPYIGALQAAGGDPSGYPTPEWDLDATFRSMDEVGSDIGILSLSTPGVPIAGTGKVARELTRTLNHFFANATGHGRGAGRLGFFGILPDWQDVSGTLEELDFLYKEQKLCNGVTVYTTYGGRLLGDPLFAPIWKRLQHYKALVFVHPGVLDIHPKFIAGALPQPIVDYPLATTRTAVDLVMSQTLHRCPDIDIILSHAGGTLPFLGSRASGSLAIPAIGGALNYNILEAKKQFARFYYDIALSTSRAQLHGLLDFADESRILFGSDYPYVPQFGINAVVAEYALFVATDARGEKLRPEALRRNSMNLLNKHSLNKRF